MVPGVPDETLPADVALRCHERQKERHVTLLAVASSLLIFPLSLRERVHIDSTRTGAFFSSLLIFPLTLSRRFLS